jgi:hypothetical protein
MEGGIVDGKIFDGVARDVAGRSRRAVIGTLAAGAAASLGWSGAAAAPKTAARRDPGLRLLEQFAATLEQETGDCAALTAAADAFANERQTELQTLLADEADWSPSQRRKHTKRNRARIVAAVQAIHAQLASCGFRGATESPICAADGGTSPFGQPGEATCSGCDCGCICPLSSGECTAQCLSCSFTGSRHACCWCGTCIDNNCSKQCVNCCDLPED